MYLVSIHRSHNVEPPLSALGMTMFFVQCLFVVFGFWKSLWTSQVFDDKTAIFEVHFVAFAAFVFEIFFAIGGHSNMDVQAALEELRRKRRRTNNPGTVTGNQEEQCLSGFHPCQIGCGAKPNWNS